MTVLRIGITGHVRLTQESRALILEALRAELRRQSTAPVRGITCLADGTDQIFAQAVLAENGTFEVVLPARNYRKREIHPDNRDTFDLLLRRAERVTYAFPVSCRLAYAIAGRQVLSRCDRLLAVWDGGGGGIGGTAAVVAAARRRGLPVSVIWPAGARRSNGHAHTSPASRGGA